MAKMFAQFQMIYWAHEHWTVSIARIMRTTHWRRARGQTIAFVKRHTIVLLYRHTTVFVQRNTIVYVQRSTKILNLNDSNILGACCKPIIDQILVTAPSSGWPLVISCPHSNLYHRFISGSLYTAPHTWDYNFICLKDTKTLNWLVQSMAYPLS